jgi:hypothetical protein
MSFSWLPTRWLTPRRGDRRGPQVAPPSSTFRPQLESLEDRWVPATFNLSGTILTINGTAAADTFTYSASTVYGGGTLTTTYSFTMDDQTASYDNTQVTQVFMLGMGGSDSAYIALNDTFTTPGSPNPQQLTFSVLTQAGGGYVYDSSGNAFMILSGIKNTFMTVGTNDGATMYTTPGSSPSLFVSAGSYSYTTGNGEFHYVTGAPNVLGIAMGSGDAAYHYDGVGANTFVASGNAYSYMTGTDNGQQFYNLAVGFNLNYGIATRGTSDTAILYDSPGSDVLVSTPSTTYQYGFPNGVFYYDQVMGFSKISAYSFQGGLDNAYLMGGLVTVGGNYHVFFTGGGPR